MTGKSIYVKPVKGARVRRAEPPHAVIPDEGASVPDTSFYRRRIREDSLEIGKPPRTPAAKPSASKE